MATPSVADAIAARHVLQSNIRKMLNEYERDYGVIVRAVELAEPTVNSTGVELRIELPGLTT